MVDGQNKLVGVSTLWSVKVQEPTSARSSKATKDLCLATSDMTWGQGRTRAVDAAEWAIKTNGPIRM